MYSSKPRSICWCAPRFGGASAQMLLRMEVTPRFRGACRDHGVDPTRRRRRRSAFASEEPSYTHYARPPPPGRVQSPSHSNQRLAEPTEPTWGFPRDGGAIDAEPLPIEALHPVAPSFQKRITLGSRSSGACPVPPMMLSSEYGTTHPTS